MNTSPCEKAMHCEWAILISTTIFYTIFATMGVVSGGEKIVGLYKFTSLPLTKRNLGH